MLLAGAMIFVFFFKLLLFIGISKQSTLIQFFIDSTLKYQMFSYPRCCVVEVPCKIDGVIRNSKTKKEKRLDVIEINAHKVNVYITVSLMPIIFKDEFSFIRRDKCFLFSL